VTLAVSLDLDLVAWARTAGGSAFCTAARRRFVNGGKLDRWLDIRLDHGQLTDLHALFGHDKHIVRPEGVHLRRADEALRRTKFGIGVRRLVIGVGGPIITRRGRKRYRDWQNRYRVAEQRLRLWHTMRETPDLDPERRLLECLELGTTSQVPPDSRTGTRTWSTYEAAIKAAVYWYPEWSPERVPWEREVATNALDGSKKWTMAQLEAFARLVGKDLKEALSWTDAPIRVAGPLTWQDRTPIADANLGHPWIDVPAVGSLEAGELDCPADGVLLVENITTFEHLRKNTDLTERWLCVWLEGNVSKGLIPFLQRIHPARLAAWCDLDPDGIEIVQSVEQGLGRPVLPVGMSPEIWAMGKKLVEKSPDKYDENRKAAAKLAVNGPESLRSLADAIAATGKRCEQEGIQFKVTPVVVRQLKQLAEEVQPA
jgi:hypothetical protein